MRSGQVGRIFWGCYGNGLKVGRLTAMPWTTDEKPERLTKEQWNRAARLGAKLALVSKRIAARLAGLRKAREAQREKAPKKDR